MADPFMITKSLLWRKSREVSIENLSFKSSPILRALFNAASTVTLRYPLSDLLLFKNPYNNIMLNSPGNYSIAHAEGACFRSQKFLDELGRKRMPKLNISI